MTPERRARRRRARIGGGRGSVAPDAAEAIELRADDGWGLHGEERPACGRAVGVAVLVHGMFSRRDVFARPSGAGVARFLAARGWRTVAFDLRGHGASAPSASRGGAWTYDDVVRRDLPAIVDAVRARAGALPVVVAGHSLGGHAALAAHAVGAIAVDGLLLVAATPWLRRWDASDVRWARRRALGLVARAVLEHRGYFPARRLRQGSDDEAYGLMNAVLRAPEEGSWRSDDGRDDYASAIARVRVPLVALVSDGDRTQAPPDCVARLVGDAAGPREVVRVRAADDGGPPPSHAGIVVDGTALDRWGQAESWLRARLPC